MSNHQFDYLILTRLRDNRIRNAGPNILMFTLGGNSASVTVPNTFAKIKSSPSGTRRCRVSSLASDSLLTSQPKTCNFADKSSCVQPLRSRNSRTCVPIRFSGKKVFLMLAKVAARIEQNVLLRSQMRLVNRKLFPQNCSRTSDIGHMQTINTIKRLVLSVILDRQTMVSLPPKIYSPAGLPSQDPARRLDPCNVAKPRLNIRARAALKGRLSPAVILFFHCQQR